MTSRIAACSCGQLHIECRGEPIRISMCHCLACQRRTGSAFAAQARFPKDRVGPPVGRATRYVRISDEGNAIPFSFCPDCGSTVFYGADDEATTAIPLGAFADPSFPPPTVSVYEERQHAWVSTAHCTEHHH